MRKIVIFTLMFISTLVSNCKNKDVNKTEILLNTIETKFEVSLDDYKYLCIINDGGCLPCNRIYSKALTDASKSNDFLIIIAESGSVLNLRAFDYDAPNIYHTYDDILGESQMKAGSYFGKLKNGECESLDYIDPKRTESIMTEIQLILER
ncbi:MAG: hypothetical protein U9N51_08850 [Bacteroidota bacterium]|nr:hypothetical protein [Bacteroidota bacterium]